jgi:L-ribulose-5-phosphate 3-epimerase
MKKGVCQLSFPDNMAPREMFKWARDAGFDGVELCPGGGAKESESGTSVTGDLGLDAYPNDAFNFDTPDKDIAAIKGVAQEYGLEIPSVLALQSFSYPLTVADPKERERNKGYLRRILKMASLVGASSILTIPGVVNEDRPYDEVYKLSQESLRDCAAYAQEVGVIIAVEDVWNKFLISPLEMARFIDEINHPFVKCHFDVANILFYGYPEQWIRILNNRIVKIHFKDFIPAIGTILGFPPLLHGNVNWAGVMKAIKEIGYDGWVITEVVPPNRFLPEQAIREASNSVDAILKGLG